MWEKARDNLPLFPLSFLVGTGQQLSATLPPHIWEKARDGLPLFPLSFLVGTGQQLSANLPPHIWEKARDGLPLFSLSFLVGTGQQPYGNQPLLHMWERRVPTHSPHFPTHDLVGTGQLSSLATLPPSRTGKGKVPPPTLPSSFPSGIR
jgi:hypothetical protein